MKQVLAGKRALTLLIIFTLIMSMFVVPPVSANAEKITYFVAADAQAGGDGSIEHPFASIEEARDAIRELKANNAYPESGVTVYLRGGEYRRTDTFTLTSEDSGTEQGPIVYSAYNDEEVNFVGGASLNLSDFTITQDNRLPAEAKGKVYSINLKAKGIKDYGNLAVTGHSQYYLYTNGWAPTDGGLPNPIIMFDETPLTLARYPNEGFATIGRILNLGVLENKNENPNAKMDGFEFVANDPHYDRWLNAAEPWVFTLCKYDWSDLSQPIAYFNSETKSIKTKYASPFTPTEGRLYYVYNMIEELDIPGEWFYDKNNGELYIYPPNSNANASINLGFGNEKLVNANKVENVEFRNITFQGTRSSGISLTDCKNFNIKYCVVKNVSGDGVQLLDDCRNCQVTGCRIYQIGQSGVTVSGGVMTTLEPGNNIVQDCVIHTCAQMVRQLKPNVRVTGVANIVRNNLLYDSPCQAIICGGFDLVIEYNEIHSVQKEGNDAGAIYAGQRPDLWGSIIRGNLIHDVYSDTAGTNADYHGIYLDGWSSGYTVTENIIYNTHSGIFCHGGHHNTVENNIIANNEDGVHISGVYDGQSGTMRSVFSDKTLHANLDSPTVREKYGEQYQYMVDISDDPSSLDPRWNVARNNLCYNVTTPGIFKIGNRPVTNEWFFENNDLATPYSTSADMGFISITDNNWFLNDLETVKKRLPDFEFNVKPEDIGVSLVRLKKNLEKDAIALVVGKPGAYVNWERKLIDENNYNLVPFIENDTTYVPLRFFAESLGAEVDFDGESAIVNYNGAEMKIKAGSTDILLNGETFELPAPVKNVDNRIFVPLRACNELFGKKVLWNESGLIIISDRDLTDALSDRELKAMADRI